MKKQPEQLKQPEQTSGLVRIHYNIYNHEDRLVATVIKNKEKWSLVERTSSKRDLPFMLQEKPSSDRIEMFLESRVLPKRPDVIKALQERGLEYNWQEMIKLNSGMVYTDNFYVLTVENGVEQPRKIVTEEFTEWEHTEDE